jgi:NAD-dependent SIR2 family protein deacetylase
MTDAERARAAIREADALLVTAGAGMGVDSGLPDFRGDQGFWRAYPAFEKLRLGFEDLANPRWFRDDPELAWGFYGHRLELYRATRPHDGFHLLRRCGERKQGGCWVFTSNVDGQFQRAGFTDVVECHGAIDWLQCLAGCGTFSAEGVSVTVDPATFRAAQPLPACPKCKTLARPNILMFGDGGWDSRRSYAQEERFDRWLSTLDGAKLVIIECGAGTAIPTVRLLGESLVHQLDATLIRINPREPDAPHGISIRTGARDGLNLLTC